VTFEEWYDHTGGNDSHRPDTKECERDAWNAAVAEERERIVGIVKMAGEAASRDDDPLAVTEDIIARIRE
jgi:hypothetical protein